MNVQSSTLRSTTETIIPRTLQDGQRRLSPAYDVTFCEGPGGYHQMDVMGEVLSISRTHMLRLAEEAEVPPEVAGRMIDGIFDVASRFARIAEDLYPEVNTQETLRTIQGRIDQNVARLNQGHASSGRRSDPKSQILDRK